MGIPSYFSHFVRQHRQIIKQISKNTKQINNLYLDCNSFIYDGVNSNRTNTNEDVLITYVCDKLIYYISLLKPNKSVFIAFDGVAPMAKQNQQKKRRYLSWFQSNTLKKTFNTTEVTWNTSAITPGTLFMSNLSDAIKKRFNNPKEFGLEKIIISSSDEVGEGEHKLFQYIRNNQQYHKSTNTVIYGLDADLIMLTLNHLHISDSLYLFRETPEFIKSIDNTLNPNQLYLLDIPEFGKSIISEFTPVNVTAANGISTANGVSTANNKINDYVFLFFLLGNDFLPHFPALNIRTNGIDTLLNAYKHILNSKGLYLTCEDTIIWKNVRLLIEYISLGEWEYIKQEYKVRDKLKKRFNNKETAQQAFEAKLINLPSERREVEHYINPMEVGWEERYYHSLFDVRIDDERRKEICTNYLEGLEWTFKYYRSDCVDWRWTYKYDYPPLLVDLIKYIPYFDTCFLTTKVAEPVSAVEQLSYVLPKQSLYLIPGGVGEKLLQEHPERYDDNCEFQWAFCKYFWEAHVKGAQPPLEPHQR